MKRHALEIALGLVLMLTLTVSAHHEPMSLGTVRITQPVMAGGIMLQPGAYEIRDNGEHVPALPGQSPDAQTQIEFVANGVVVARDVAEVMALDSRPVGTSGTASAPRAQVLKGGEFLRVSVSREGNRYLIHLPIKR